MLHRSVTGFASRVDGVRPGRDQPGVVGGRKTRLEFLVTLFAFLGADVLRAGTFGSNTTERVTVPHEMAASTRPARQAPAPVGRAVLFGLLARMLRLLFIIDSFFYGYSSL